MLFKVAVIFPVPEPCKSPDNTIVWSPVLVPEILEVPATVRVLAVRLPPVIVKLLGLLVN